MNMSYPTVDRWEFERRSRQMATDLIDRHPNHGIVYLPMETGGVELGKPFADYLLEHAPMRTYPIRRDRKRKTVTSPDVDDVRDGVHELRREASRILAVGYDDVIGTGLDIMILYRWLLDNQKEMGIDTVQLATGLDTRGLAHYACMSAYTTRVERDAYCEEILSMPSDDSGSVFGGWVRSALGLRTEKPHTKDAEAPARPYDPVQGALDALGDK